MPKVLLPSPSLRKILARAGLARRWALHVVVLAALVVGLFRSGARYFYCPMMGEIHDAPCCDQERSEGAGIGEAECCQARLVGQLPAGAASSLLELPLAPRAYTVRLAVAACRSLEERAPVGAEIPRRPVPRTRTGPPAASVRRARLGVYLI